MIEWLKRRPTPDYYFSGVYRCLYFRKGGYTKQSHRHHILWSIANLQKAVPSAKVLSNVRFVDNGKVITTAGISAGIDGALHLVAKIHGQETARNVATYKEYDKWVPDQGHRHQK